MQNGNSLELEAEAVRIHPQVLSSSPPQGLCANQEAEVQAGVLSLPSLHTPTLSEWLLVVKADLTID